ncbi:MAG: tRNA (adenosine(37)-N6)-threonylcarbamoyltransferase complex dimerization subunit type 1 TsaB [Candidatus Zixiibacteriota bacterium]|nr:MAG: tRNA (adenosine(37)-N6)-threonylcarbamoyltransferase complex dimerization subunit type 1 TsaB [candidate division Zixibacteria bacterium]
MEMIQPHTLAIDSSTSVLRVGISLENGEVLSLENKDRYRHAEFVFRLINDLFDKSGIDKFHLKAIVVSIGPGSFTGLRVGMASAKGMAASMNIPLVGISTYSAVAPRLFARFGRTAVLIPSRRDEYYFGLVDSAEFADESISIIRPEKLEAIDSETDLWGVDFDVTRLGQTRFRIITPTEFEISIRDFLAPGEARLKESGGDDISSLEPLYIQNFPAGTSP